MCGAYLFWMMRLKSPLTFKTTAGFNLPKALGKPVAIRQITVVFKLSLCLNPKNDAIQGLRIRNQSAAETNLPNRKGFKLFSA